MRKELINIGKKSKKAFTTQLNSKKKNKVLKDYCNLIEKNKKWYKWKASAIEGNKADLSRIYPNSKK